MRYNLFVPLIALAFLLSATFAGAQPTTIRFGNIDTTRVSTVSWNGTVFNGTISWGPFSNLPTGPLTLSVAGNVGTVTDGQTNFVLPQPYKPPAGNWSYTSQSGKLDVNGASANVAVPMPPGLIWRSNLSDGLYRESAIGIGTQSLDQEARIAGVPIVNGITEIKLENDPFSFGTSFVLFSDADGWEFNNIEYRYTYADEYADLGMQRPSNDAFLRLATVEDDVVRGTPLGANFTLVGNTPISYLSGFPSGVNVGGMTYTLEWQNSRLLEGTANAAVVTTTYRNGSCTAGNPVTAESYGAVAFTVGSDGAVIGAADNSGLPSKTYAFDALTIGPMQADGTVYIPGWKAPHDVEVPHAYLIAGRRDNGTDHADLHYPGEDAYEEGQGYYAGYTLTQSQLVLRPFSLKLACTDAPFSSLASKVYHRFGGFSGTLDADPNSVAALPPLELYGEYQTVLTKFNYTFLDNKQHQKSQIDGAISLPFPADVTLEFASMELESCGAPGAADVVQPSNQILAYWAREFRFSELSFRSLSPPQTQSCAGVKTDKRNLWTISSNPIPEVPRPLLVETRFAGNGNILDAISSAEADSTIQGYPATVRKVYYNKYPGAGDFGDGFTLIAADVTLPFWGATPIIAMWDAGSFPQFFNGDAYAMSPPGDPDPDRNGFPAGVANFEAYKDSANHRPIVRGAFASIIKLEYPVKYDPIAQRFATVAGEEKDRNLVVLNVSSSVRGITQDQNEILFGLSYSGLPTINLSSLLEDFADPALQQLLAPLKDGMDQVNGGLAGSLSEALRGPLEELTRPVVNTMVAELQAAAGPGNGSVDALMLQAMADARMGQIKLALESGLISSTGPLVTKLDSMVGSLENIADNIESLPVDQVMVLLEALAELAGADTEGLEIVRQDVAAARAYIVDNLINQKLKPALQEARGLIQQGQELVALPQIQAMVGGAEFNTAAQAIQNELNKYLIARAGAASKIRNLDPEDVNRRIVEALLNNVLMKQINGVVVKLMEPIKAQAQNMVNGFFDTLNNQLKSYLDQVGGFINNITQQFNDVVGVKAAEIAGYAIFGKTTLDRLHIDAAFELAAPDNFGFRGSMDMERFVNDSKGVVCGTPAGQESIRVKIAVFDIPIKVPRGSLIAKEIALLLRLNQKEGQETFFLSDVAGMIDTQGSINFEAAKILSPFFSAGVGANETYIAFRGGLVFNGTAMRGGIFLGRTCNAIELLSTIDPELDGVITEDEVTGIYAFGEAAIPILDYSCMLKVGATAGAGFWFFVEGPSYGGKLTAGVWGKALCIISVRGKLILIGAKDASGFKFKGTGWLAGGLGWCEPEAWFTIADVWADKWCWTCVLYASVLYHNSWSVDYDADCEP